MITALLLSAPPGLTASLLAGLAVMGLVRWKRQSSNGMFSLLCLFGCFLNLDILMQLNAKSAQAALASARQWHLFHPFLAPLFIHFMHAYLGIGNRTWLVATAYGGAALIAALSQSDWVVAHAVRFSFGYAVQGGPLYPFMAAGAISATLYNARLLSGAIQREKQSVFKNKLRYMYAGLLSLGALTCLNLLGRFGFPVYPPGAFGFIPLGVFAAGVLKYDLLDLGVLLRRGLFYFLLAMVLALLCTMAMLILHTAAGQRLLSVSFWLSFLFILPAAMAVGLVKVKIQSYIDRLLADPSYDYRQTIKQASRKIASALDYAQIARLLDDTLIRSMGVEHAALFVGNSGGGYYTAIAAVGDPNAIASCRKLRASKDSIQLMTASCGPLIRPRLLEQIEQPSQQKALGAMAAFGAEVVLPMVYCGKLNGFLMLGEKTSGGTYLPADIDLLETLGHQAALAIENAKAYEALRKLNHSLEEQVAVRTCELQQALEEKERVQDQLVRTESLAAIGQLVAGVAHELNNPLASASSLLQSTMEDLDRSHPENGPDDELVDDLRFAQKELARAKSIVSSLLALSRQTQVYTEAVDLNTLVADALRMLQTRIMQQSLTIKLRLAPGPIIVQGNFANLGQAVVNVIVNAIQAVSGQDGVIILRSGTAGCDGMVWFSCQDNGPGIDESIRNDVFKPFFTTKAVGQGTGLGLYICHGIVQKHGGCITIHASPIGGAEVSIHLPAAEPGHLAGPRAANLPGPMPAPS